MKKRFFLSVLIFALYSNTGFAMEQQSQEQRQLEQAYFTKFEVKIPLRPDANAPRLRKDAYMQVPSNLVKARESAHEQDLIPADIASSVANTLIAVHEQETLKELLSAITTCIHLMFNNDQGWYFPQNEVGLQRVNPELLSLIKASQSYFIYSKEAKRLIVRWDLGEHTDGWAFDKIIAIELDQKHPNKGICSALTVQYHNERKNIHDKVLLETLREVYAKADKKTTLNAHNIAEQRKKLTEDKINAMQVADIVAMALHYVNNLNNDPAAILK